MDIWITPGASAAAAGLLVLAGIGLLKRFFPEGQGEDHGRSDEDQG